MLSNQIYCFLSFWTFYCELYPMFSTSRTYTVLSRLAMYGTGFCSFLKINACFLTRRCLIWNRKQHTFGTFARAFETKPFRFRSFKSKQFVNKLSSRQNQVYNNQTRSRLFRWFFIKYALVSFASSSSNVHYKNNWICCAVLKAAKYEKQKHVSRISPL